MTRTPLRRLSLFALAGSAALALAACGDAKDGADTAAPVASEPIAAIPAPEGASWVETAHVSPADGYVMGNPDAPIKLVEYASHTCSHCAAFSMEAAAPLEEYVESGRVSYEIRNQIHDPLDLTIAMLARCGAPESFHPLASQAWSSFEDIIQTAQANGEQLNAAIQAPAEQRYQLIAEASGLLDFFAARGISRDQAMQCLADPERAEEIASNSQTQSDELGVTGTPAFFINGNRIDGTSWAVVEPALQQAGAR